MIDKNYKKYLNNLSSAIGLIGKNEQNCWFRNKTTMFRGINGGWVDWELCTQVLAE
jgi:hypothetical protein